MNWSRIIGIIRNRFVVMVALGLIIWTALLLAERLIDRPVFIPFPSDHEFIDCCESQTVRINTDVSLQQIDDDAWITVCVTVTSIIDYELNNVQLAVRLDPELKMWVDERRLVETSTAYSLQTGDEVSVTITANIRTDAYDDYLSGLRMALSEPIAVGIWWDGGYEFLQIASDCSRCGWLTGDRGF